jgi:copper chaperone
MNSFLIPDMTCGHCVGVIKKTLLAADPEASLEIELSTHLLKIDSKLGISQIVTLLEEAGYSPSLQSQ